MSDDWAPAGGYLSRRESDLLRAELHETRAWLERIDSQGTRNSGVTEAKVIDQGGDIGELKAELRAHLDDHKRVTDKIVQDAADERERAARDRATHRRWVIATAGGALGGLAGWIGVLYEVMHHAH